jgi:hypothetical protein
LYFDRARHRLGIVVFEVVEGFLHAALLDPQEKVLEAPGPNHPIILPRIEPAGKEGAEARNRRVPAFAVRVPPAEVLGPLAG